MKNLKNENLKRDLKSEKFENENLKRDLSKVKNLKNENLKRDLSKIPNIPFDIDDNASLRLVNNGSGSVVLK